MLSIWWSDQISLLSRASKIYTQIKLHQYDFCWSHSVIQMTKTKTCWVSSLMKLFVFFKIGFRRHVGKHKYLCIFFLCFNIEEFGQLKKKLPPTFPRKYREFCTGGKEHNIISRAKENPLKMSRNVISMFHAKVGMQELCHSTFLWLFCLERCGHVVIEWEWFNQLNQSPLGRGLGVYSGEQSTSGSKQTAYL